MIVQDADFSSLVTRRTALGRSIGFAMAMLASELLQGCKPAQAQQAGVVQSTRPQLLPAIPATPTTASLPALPSATPLAASAPSATSTTPASPSPTASTSPTAIPTLEAATPTPDLSAGRAEAGRTTPTRVPATRTPVRRPPSTPAPTASTTGRTPPKPAMLTPDQWGARKPTKPFTTHTLVRITLHHEGVIFDGSLPAPRYLRAVQRWSMDDRGWPDLPYHYLLDLQGVIYMGRPVTAVGDTNTMYDPTGHALIAVLGQYDQQRPNQAQLNAVVRLMAWLSSAFTIPLTHIAGHRDFIPVNKAGKHIDQRTNFEITCPGANLYLSLQNGYFVREVRRLMTNE